MSGSYKILVEKESAVQCGSDKSDILPINCSHSEMVKFREGSKDYNVVAGYIHELTKSLSNGLGTPKSSTATQRIIGSTSHLAQNDPLTSNVDRGT